MQLLDVLFAGRRKESSWEGRMEAFSFVKHQKPISVYEALVNTLQILFCDMNFACESKGMKYSQVIQET